ncbi:MAG: hypothetical protein ACW967_04435 [Candidatus Hodarchaeales archaeon]
MIVISKGKKKKDLHRKPSTQKQRILNRFQRYEVYTEQTAKTLKQMDLSDKKYSSFIENLTTDGTLKSETREGITRYWLKTDKIKPKEKKDSFLLSIVVFSVVFVVLMFVLFAFS